MSKPFNHQFTRGTNSIKKAFPFFVFLCVSVLPAQTDSVKSNVYYWETLKPDKSGAVERREILEGTVTDFSSLSVNAIILKPGQSIQNTKAGNEMEELIIVKEGKAKVTVGAKGATLLPGSVVLIMPGEKYSVEGAGKEPSTLYSMKYVSKSLPDRERGNNAGGSLIVDWNNLVFKEHERGGIRHCFERPTVMAKRFEMHVTTLKGEIKSHEPHTHRAEEIVLILNGNVEMQIGEGFHKASIGDLIYLGSNVPHALRNTGKESCMYFAFQFE